MLRVLNVTPDEWERLQETEAAAHISLEHRAVAEKTAREVLGNEVVDEALRHGIYKIVVVGEPHPRFTYLPLPPPPEWTAEALAAILKD